jgi:hypothetical protein
MHGTFLLETLKGTNHMVFLPVDVRIILKWIIDQYVFTPSELKWLIIGSNNFRNGGEPSNSIIAVFPKWCSAEPQCSVK